MSTFNLQPLTCHCCGGKIDRRIMRCEYCGTEYAPPNDRIKVIVEQPGTHIIRCETRIDCALMQRSPEAARDYTLQDMRQQIADGLLAYMRLTTFDDIKEMCQIVRGEVRVLDPYF